MQQHARNHIFALFIFYSPESCYLCLCWCCCSRWCWCYLEVVADQHFLFFFSRIPLPKIPTRPCPYCLHRSHHWTNYQNDNNNNSNNHNNDTNSSVLCQPNKGSNWIVQTEQSKHLLFWLCIFFVHISNKLFHFLLFFPSILNMNTNTTTRTLPLYTTTYPTSRVCMFLCAISHFLDLSSFISRSNASAPAKLTRLLEGCGMLLTGLIACSLHGMSVSVLWRSYLMLSK